MTGKPDSTVWIGRFLGDAACEGGPFALLGLPHEITEPAQLGDAVRRRLQAIDAHPLRLTPEADEVRLAVHAAAAQLADPALRVQLAMRFPPGKPASVPRAWQTHLRTLTPQLRARARHIIGASGGWNRKAKARLAMVARQHRVSAIDLVRGIRPRPAARPDRTAQPRSPLPSVPWPVPSGKMWLTIHAFLLALLAVISGVTIAELLHPAPTVPAPRTPPVVSDTIPKPDPATPPVRSEYPHFSAMEQELANASGSLATDRDGSLRRADRVRSAFLGSWIDIPTDARARLAARLASFHAAEKADAPTAGPTPTSPATATPASDAMARVIDNLAASEPTSPPDGPSIDHALIEQLRNQISDASHAPASWWRSWTDAVSACTGTRQETRDQLVLTACTRLISGQAEPPEGVPAVARTLAKAVPWRAGDPSRVWLLQQLEDPAADPDALAAFVRVLATEVSVPGINPADTLPTDPNIARRQRLADTLRTAWSELRPPLTPLQTELIESLRAALAEKPNPDDPTGMLQTIEALVRFNAAAALAHEGKEEQAAERLSDAYIPLSPRDPAPLPPDDPTIGVRLLNADTDEDAADLLRELARNPLNAANADALVETATLGRSGEIREQARRIVLVNGSEPFVLLALERRVTDRTRGTVRSLIEQILGVPSGSDAPMGDRTLREALLIRAAERSPGVSPDLRYLELQIDEHLSARAGLPTGEPAPVSIAALIESLTEELTSLDADPPPPKPGPAVAGTASALAARHRELVELIALSMRHDTELWTPLTEPILAQLAVRWREGDTATAQILATQQAEARLWLLRLEGLP